MEEKAEPQREKNGLEELQDIIAGARESIEAGFKRTQNPWHACFVDKFTGIRLFVEDPRTKVLLSPEQHQLALKRLDELEKLYRQFKKQYPERANVPPDEIKEELLSKLDVLRNE